MIVVEVEQELIAEGVTRRDKFFVCVTFTRMFWQGNIDTSTAKQVPQGHLLIRLK
jgi:hypothetical protein